MSDGTIRIEITGDADDLRRAAKAAEQALKSLDRENKKTAASAAGVSKAARGQTQDLATTERAFRGTRGAARDFNLTLNTTKNVIGLLKWPTIIAGAGTAAQALTEAAAGGTALAGSLARLAPLAGA